MRKIGQGGVFCLTSAKDPKAADARFNDLRVWRDLNRDGISQAGELSTLAQAGVASIHLSASAANTNLGNGNRISATGTYTTTSGVSRQAVNLDLAQNRFWRDYTDRHFEQITLTPEAQALPDLIASGQVRDLREAMSLDGTLATTVAGLAGNTRGQMLAAMDGLIDHWAGTSTMQTSIGQAAALAQLTQVEQTRLKQRNASNDSIWERIA